MSILNPEQQECVNHVEGPLLVLAGAGSGKTRVVTERIAHLIDIGIPASDIIAVTFTNKAASEMRERVQRICSQRIWASTFHSLCASILRESIHHLGYKNDFTIYDEQDSEMLLKSSLKSLNIKDEKAFVKSIRHAISNAKNNLQSPEDLPNDDSLKGHSFKEVYSYYQNRLKSYNALDFDDLLYLCAKLFTDCPDVLDHYQNKWPFLLIDEYQDTNHAQYTLAKLLIEKSQNIFAVGDPDQSIYSWRGADIHNILRFEQDFPGAKIVHLEQNYRSTSTILQAANSLIQKNTKRYEKNLWSDLGDGEKIHFHLNDNDIEEARYVIQTLKKRKRMDGIRLSDAVIFYRTNSQSRSFEDALLREDIPYKIVGGISFYQRREIKDIIAFLRLILSSYDFMAFQRTINIPKRGFGQTSIKKLKEASEASQVTIIDLCFDAIANAAAVKLSQKQQANMHEFLQALNQCRQLNSQKPQLGELIEEVLIQFRYLDYLKEDPQTYDDRKSNIEELIAKAVEYQEENSEATLREFLEELTLKVQSTEGEEQEQLTLMTLHNGKGLEFPLVFMVGMEEDLFPHINTKDSPEGLEEERRLCYVGMTRAKQFLYLTAAKYRIIWGTPKYMRPSRFIEEVDSAFIEKPYSEEPIASNDDDLYAGCYVLHKNFGRGIIKKKYSTSLGLTYDVYFIESNNMKTLVAKYAKLRMA